MHGHSVDPVEWLDPHWIATVLGSKLPEVAGAAGEARAPWYVRVMLGIAGWIGAMFLLGFVGAGFAFVMRSSGAMFVVGAGSGGVRAARIAAAHGARVAIAEEHRIGGTCVIRGCVPKKLMVYASRFSEDFADSAGFGWHVPHATFDWAALIATL